MIYKTEFFNEYFDEVPEGTPDARAMESAYNNTGEYVGTVCFGKRLEEEFGIADPELAHPSDYSCSIGFSEENQRWYGWSHRAIAGFGVGSTVKLGDCAYRPANKTDFLRMVEDWYSDEMYKNLEIVPTSTGVKVSYDIIPLSDDPKINTEELIVDLKEILPNCDFTELSSSCPHSETIIPYPTEWGKGEWTAKSLEDAKQMAIDFAEDVS